jgi:hypothetical protein
MAAKENVRMKEPTTPQQDRKPGRSFNDPNRPMGEALLEGSAASGTIKEDFRAREVQASVPHNGVAERAKVIGVLRKAEELMVEGNLPHGQATPRRALELASGRVGLTIKEYDALVKDDPELMELERKILLTPIAPTR